MKPSTSVPVNFRASDHALRKGGGLRHKLRMNSITKAATKGAPKGITKGITKGAKSLKFLLCSMQPADSSRPSFFYVLQ